MTETMTSTNSPYECYHCEKPTQSTRRLPPLDGNGTGRWEALCDDCYEEWLHSLKG